MSFNHTYSAVLRGNWMLKDTWVNQQLPVINNYLKQPMKDADIFYLSDASFMSHSNSREQISEPYLLSLSTGESEPMYITNQETNKALLNGNFNYKNAAVIDVFGILTKYNRECGEPGTLVLAGYVSDVKRLANTVGIILKFDSPGGEISAAPPVINELLKLKKPIISYVMGEAAALSYCIACTSNEIFVSDKLDQVGSIGVSKTIFDYSKLLEKDGIRSIDIYAPQSTEKNKSYLDALAGDYKAIQDDLKIKADYFINHIKKMRGQKAIENEKNWRTGKMFYANEAISNGLIDSVLNFEQVVGRMIFLTRYY